MDAPKMTKSWSFKQPLIKINSIPLSKLDEDETTIEESTPLTMVPPPGGFSSSAAAAAGMHMLDSKASSVTAVEVLPPLGTSFPPRSLPLLYPVSDHDHDYDYGGGY